MTHVYLNQDPGHAIPVLMAFAEECCPGLRAAAATELLRHARFALANAPRNLNHQGSRAALEVASTRAAQRDYPGTLAAIRNFYSQLADEAIGTDNDTPPPKWRAAWMNAPAGLPGQNWDQTIARAAAAGLNCLMPCMLTPYAAAYPSRILPRFPNLPQERDHLAECLAAGRRHQVAIHPWFKVLSVADAPAPVRQSLAAAGRLQCRRDGQTTPWLCPSHPANRALVAKLTAELTARYPLDGLQLDMLRYAGSEYCCCENCRQAFQRDRGGKPIDRWPDCLAEDAALRARWADFRRRQISTLAAELAAVARQNRPGIILSAAVYPDPANARNAVGQDWPAWLQAGNVAFVCPMSYRATAALLRGDLQRAVEPLGGRNAACGRLRPGIGMSGCALDRAEVHRQALTIRNAGLDGYALFEFNAATADELAR